MAVPQTVRVAVLLVRIEAASLLLGAVVLCVMAILRTSTRLWAALAIAGFALVLGVILALCARGLLGLRPTARTPVVMVQLLSLPVGYSLGFQAGRLAIALPLLIIAVATLITLFTPTARQALDRVL